MAVNYIEEILKVILDSKPGIQKKANTGNSNLNNKESYPVESSDLERTSDSKSSSQTTQTTRIKKPVFLNDLSWTGSRLSKTLFLYIYCL